MEASFDGVRKNIARGFNNLVRAAKKDEESFRSLRDPLSALRLSIVGLLCMYTGGAPGTDGSASLDAELDALEEL